MILAGDYIETGIGVTLGISTMAAAALGVLVADVLGLSVGELIERVRMALGFCGDCLPGWCRVVSFNMIQTIENTNDLNDTNDRWPSRWACPRRA